MPDAASQRQDCREKTCSSPMQKPMQWTQLLQAYEREWQFTKAEPVNGVTWSEWLAWRLRFGPKAIVWGPALSRCSFGQFHCPRPQRDRAHACCWLTSAGLEASCSTGHVRHVDELPALLLAARARHCLLCGCRRCWRSPRQCGMEGVTMLLIVVRERPTDRTAYHSVLVSESTPAIELSTSSVKMHGPTGSPHLENVPYANATPRRHHRDSHAPTCAHPPSHQLTIKSSALLPY